ncbi:MAG: efflux RND transporter periplasmic adaptor subunit [Acidobacteriota bacterium]
MERSAPAGKMNSLLRPTVLLALLLGIALGILLSFGLFRGSKAVPALDSPKEGEEKEHGKGASHAVIVEKEAQANVGLKIVEVATRPMVTTLQTTGIVSPNETRVAHVRPLARGLIEKVFVRLGDRVKAGDSLVRYDNIELGELINEYLSSLAQEEKERTNVEVSQKFLDRSKALLENQAIAQKEYELKEAEYKNAQAALERQRADLAKYEEKLHRFGLSDKDIEKLHGPEHQQAHRTASHNVLRAPFAGIITKYDVAEGELVEPDRELFTITDIDTVWVLADVYEKDISLIREGQQVEIAVATYPDKIFTGKITYVSDVIDPTSRSAKVRCGVENKSHELKLDMFATVRVPTSHSRQVLAIPASSLQNIDGKSVAFAQVGESEFVPRALQVGAQQEGWVEILSGLKQGEKVVAEGSFYLKSNLQRERIGGEEH